MENHQQRDDINRQKKLWKQILSGGTNKKILNDQSYRKMKIFLR
jgi:hypothetical protein